MFDFGSIAYLLVLGANLALVLLVAGLAFDRARDAWNKAAARARQIQAINESFEAGIKATEAKAVELSDQITAAKAKLGQAKIDAEALKKRHAHEPVPFVFRGTPTENFDPGGPIWEYLIKNEAEGSREQDKFHPAAQWKEGRLYMVQAATQAAAVAQLERRFPAAEGFRAILVKQHDRDAMSLAG